MKLSCQLLFASFGKPRRPCIATTPVPIAFAGMTVEVTVKWLLVPTLANEVSNIALIVTGWPFLIRPVVVS